MVSTGPGIQEKSDKCLSAPPAPGEVQDFQKTCFNLGKVWEFNKLRYSSFASAWAPKSDFLRSCCCRRTTLGPVGGTALVGQPL